MNTGTNEAKPTNLNYLFIDMLPNFAHIVTTEKQTKNEFAEQVKAQYCTSNPKTDLFIQSIYKSEFETIRLNNTRSAILLNQ